MDADEDLLSEIQRALGGPATASSDVVAMADVAWAWRDVDAELATLTYDSMDEEPSLVRGPSSTGQRMLVFEAGQLSLELERSAQALVGQLVPPVEGEVAVFGPAGELGRTDTDELGCFSVALGSRGPVRLRCRTSAGQLVTEWVRL